MSGRSTSVVPPADPGGGASEIHRLQELLHQALRREAEALKKLKHLNETITNCERDRPTCGSISSASDGPDFRVDSPVDDWDREEGQVQSTEIIPAVVVNVPPQLAYRRTFSQPSSPYTSDRRLMATGDGENSVKMSNSHHLQNGREWWGSSDSVTSSLPTLLAPHSRDLKDVRSEREKPLPMIHRSVTPDQIISSILPAHNSIPQREAIPVKKTLSLDRNAFKKLRDEKKLPQRSDSTSRGRTSSILRPSWLRKKNQTSTQQHPPSPKSIEALFAHFSQRSHTPHLDPLSKYIDHHWSEVCSDSGECSGSVAKYRDAVWDLFQEECKYLTRQLKPLEQVYKAFLEELHFHGLLQVADINKLFANLSELCELSASVCEDLFRLFDGRSGNRIAPNNELILVFSMFGHKFNPVYQRFCVNFENQCGFVRALQQLPDFQEYLKVCRKHKLVQKNDLSALLIAPMQHQCHYQLLLDKILRYTEDHSEKSLLSSAIKAFVVSLKELEANIADHKRSAELLELQETLCWPSVVSLDPDAYIPEVLAPLLSSQPCGKVLASKDRHLLHRGTLWLLDSRARPSTELQTFLFTDMLLLTERKPCKRELTQYVVYRRPLFLSNLELHPIPSSPSHKHLITLVEKTSLNQRVAVYSLQAAKQEEKDKWLSMLLEAMDTIWHQTKQPVQSSFVIESDV